MFEYEIENNSVMVKLLCECEYDYATDTGASACLTHAMLGGWNLAPLLSESESEEIEEWYLENWYEIDQRNTHRSIEEAKARGERI
ncbi:unnamed protein product [marine sediment metagenome]|uniref:Uncharacterized protein n=1 Tax=marine sediment metagenome TaxID=412755 RepID=X0TLK5_9ZZZZ